MRRTTIIIAAIYICAFLAVSTRAADPPTTKPSIQWTAYSNDVFANAKRDHKLIILDLQAVWCHWCHVQDEQTYANPEVAKLIGDHFLAIKVDQDSRPDIANRYEDYGWPATIVFDFDGHEIVKRRGFIEPERMISMLKAVIADPTPGPSVLPPVEIHSTTQPALSAALNAKLKGEIFDYYDEQGAGWGRGFKFIDADLIEDCTILARGGDARAEHMARQTLTAGLKLVDPAWGGVYQYSTDAVWDHAHFEKIMSYQADDMRTFARSYALWHDRDYLNAAEAIHHFLTTFLLSPDGAFYTSQDADLVPGVHSDKYFALEDAGRRRLGIPRIDTHIYARENGWAIAALVQLHEYTGDEKSLPEAIAAANWVISHRSIAGGGFLHGEKDPAGPYLGDSIAMGRAFLNLYIATADRQWLDRADAAATFIEKKFVDPKQPGVLTAVSPAGGALPVDAEVDENIAVARFARLLFQYTGNNGHEQLAGRAMRFLAAPEIAEHRGWMTAGILLADREMNSDPPHVTIVGSKTDANAATLYAAAADWPVSYKRVEWYDPHGSPLPRKDVDYPETATPSAYFCDNGACSAPITDTAKLQQKLNDRHG